jgi:hypothetical protein
MDDLIQLRPDQPWLVELRERLYASAHRAGFFKLNHPQPTQSEPDPTV